MSHHTFNFLTAINPSFYKHPNQQIRPFWICFSIRESCPKFKRMKSWLLSCYYATCHCILSHWKYFLFTKREWLCTPDQRSCLKNNVLEGYQVTSRETNPEDSYLSLGYPRTLLIPCILHTASRKAQISFRWIGSVFLDQVLQGNELKSVEATEG